MDCGVLYFLSAGGRRGAKHAVQLFVSLATLRDTARWRGSVHICAADDGAVEVAELLAALDDLGATSYERIAFDPDQEKCYAVKTRLDDYAQCQTNLYADADTVWNARFPTEFLPLDNRIHFTQFCGWTFAGNLTKSRIGHWSPEEPVMVARAWSQSWLPSVNTGVFAWRDGCDFFRHWRALCAKAPKRFIGDESAAMCLMGTYGDLYRCFPSKYNWSPIHEKTPQSEAVIIHGHGGKFFSRPQGQKIWLPLFMKYRHENRFGLRDYLGRHRNLREEMERLLLTDLLKER